MGTRQEFCFPLLSAERLLGFSRGNNNKAYRDRQFAHVRCAIQYCIIIIFITDDVFINSVVTHGFLIYPHQFSGVFRVLKLSQVGVGSGAVRGKVSFSSTLKSHRQDGRFFRPLFITNPCRNQQVRGPACYS